MAYYSNTVLLLRASERGCWKTALETFCLTTPDACELSQPTPRPPVPRDYVLFALKPPYIPARKAPSWAGGEAGKSFTETRLPNPA